MVFCYGVIVNKINFVKYVNLFLKRGYNVFIYDYCRYGKIGGKIISYGYYEKYDLKFVVDWLKNCFGINIIFGIYGEFMGVVIFF